MKNVNTIIESFNRIKELDNEITNLDKTLSTLLNCESNVSVKFEFDSPQKNVDDEQKNIMDDDDFPVENLMDKIFSSMISTNDNIQVFKFGGENNDNKKNLKKTNYTTFVGNTMAIKFLSDILDQKKKEKITIIEELKSNGVNIEETE